MKRIYINASGKCSKAILAGCYKFGVKTLTQWGGTTMTTVIDAYEENYNNGDTTKRKHQVN